MFDVLSLANAFATPSIQPGSTTLDFLVIAFVIMIAVRRLYAGINGVAYSTARLMRLPAIYLLFTIISVLDFGSVNAYVLSTLLLVPAAVIFGYRFANRCSFFYRDGRVYYRRQTYVLIFWLCSYVARLAIELFLPFNLVIEIATSSILSITTGVVIGEAMNIRKMYHEFVEVSPTPAASV